MGESALRGWQDACWHYKHFPFGPIFILAGDWKLIRERERERENLFYWIIPPYLHVKIPDICFIVCISQLLIMSLKRHDGISSMKDKQVTFSRISALMTWVDELLRNDSFACGGLIPWEGKTDGSLHFLSY